MKKLGIYMVLIIVLSLSLKAQQNLVPNYSFEQYTRCPDNISELDPDCIDWFTPMSLMNILPPPPYSYPSAPWGSSDYFNKCAQNIDFCTPKNVFGYQLPFTGDSYCGIGFANNTSMFNDYKEYIEIKLIKKLVKSHKYCLEFYISNSGYFRNIPNSYYPLELGALLTDTLVKRQSGINTAQPQNIYAIPQVSGQLPLIRDTVNWIKVSGTFIAKGGEQYLTIGNFQHTDTLTNKSVYVYIDDVKLYYCGPDTTPQPIDSLIIPNVFTPNGDGYNDKFVYKNQEQWDFETQVFNRWGDLVYNNKNSENWDGTYQGERVSAGVYFYLIKARAIKTGEIKIYRGTVNVLY